LTGLPGSSGRNPYAPIENYTRPTTYLAEIRHQVASVGNRAPAHGGGESGGVLPLRATTAAADSKRDARAAQENGCADRRIGLRPSPSTGSRSSDSRRQMWPLRERQLIGRTESLSGARSPSPEHRRPDGLRALAESARLTVKRLSVGDDLWNFGGTASRLGVRELLARGSTAGPSKQRISSSTTYSMPMSQ
jgi:hypothetical protein